MFAKPKSLNRVIYDEEVIYAVSEPYARRHS
jgi:hypothetical protein